MTTVTKKNKINISLNGAGSFFDFSTNEIDLRIAQAFKLITDEIIPEHFPEEQKIWDRALANRLLVSKNLHGNTKAMIKVLKEDVNDAKNLVINVNHEGYNPLTLEKVYPNVVAGIIEILVADAHKRDKNNHPFATPKRELNSKVKPLLARVNIEQLNKSQRDSYQLIDPKNTEWKRYEKYLKVIASMPFEPSATTSEGNRDPLVRLICSDNNCELNNLKSKIKIKTSEVSKVQKFLKCDIHKATLIIEKN